jgi:hypothetical protein
MRSLLIVALLLVLAVSAAGAATLRAADVAALADAKGGRAALETFFDCGDAGTKAYELVASGAREWLSIAVRLLNDSDACYTESLQDAIARALVPAPARVIALVNSSELLDASSICVPFLSAEEDSQKHLQYLRRAEAALHKVRIPALRQAKRACLVEFQKTRQALKMSSNHGKSNVVLHESVPKSTTRP